MQYFYVFVFGEVFVKYVIILALECFTTITDALICKPNFTKSDSFR